MGAIYFRLVFPPSCTKSPVATDGNRYMCTMLGKTLTWDDGDVTEQYPRLMDDSRSTLIRDDGDAGVNEVYQEEVEEAPSLMHAPVAHAK